MVALLCSSSWLFLALQLVCLQFVIVVFSVIVINKCGGLPVNMQRVFYMFISPEPYAQI